MAWIDSTTVTATVPWGRRNPWGVYEFTVVNPDGGTGSLTSASRLRAGIGQWNGGNSSAEQVCRILMKPGDSNTLYALANGINGLFRVRDAGEHWTYICGNVAIGNGEFAIDPLHPTWLYGFAQMVFVRSEDEGVTWTTVMPNTWPDGRPPVSPQVYVSPYDPQVLFVSASEAYGDPNATGA